jgi:4-amino-4-deoxy-L-arabinose transferase-like glycosyltransferase
MSFWEKRSVSWLILAGLVAVFLAIGISQVNDYGITWDESVQYRSGEINAQIFTGKATLDTIASFHNMRFYGPLADMLGYWSKTFFTDQLHWLAAIPAHHLCYLFFGAVLLAAVFGLGKRLGGTLMATLAAIFLLLFPRFWGEAQANPKDLPVAALFALTLWVFLRAWQTKRWWLFLISGVVWGMALAVRVNALWVPIILIVWVVISDRDRIFGVLRRRGWTSRVVSVWRRWGWSLLAAVGAAAGVMIACWPWLWPNPMSRFWEAVVSISTYEWTGLVRYGGVIYKAPELPWHYAPVMLFWVTPVLLLILAALGLVVGVVQTWRLSNRGTLLPIIWLGVVLGLIICLHINVYDGIRHFFLVVPAMILLAALGASWLYRWLARKILPPGRMMAILGLSAGLAVSGGLIACQMVKIHPYQLYYFNEIIGGCGGAFPHYEVGYWGGEFKAGAEWLNNHAESGARVAIFPTTKMAREYLRPDLQVVSEKENPDYALHITKAGLEPFRDQPGVYTLVIDGAPLVKIKKIGH